MLQCHFAIIGTGFIANIIAKALSIADNANLMAVSSRTLEKAQQFADQFSNVTPVVGLTPILCNETIDVLYIATPTTAKEAIALKGIQAGKHILIDKPLLNAASLQKMLKEADKYQVMIMDATHFVHHPRTLHINEHLDQLVGKPQSLYTSCYFPNTDKNNIRFNHQLEPTGTLGDLTWYSMRAITQYLKPQGKMAQLCVHTERDKATNTIIRLSGFMSFTSGETSSFDTGFTCRSGAMDFHLIGLDGSLSMDDFAFDWRNSFPFQSQTDTRYIHKATFTTPEHSNIQINNADKPAQTLMIERFSTLIQTHNMTDMKKYQHDALTTQSYLDAIWEKVIYTQTT
ncbi:Gfo/Idh/MocA family oxidoreductase [uncultured Shewanella sp.]|uniref:Gfo/Idh/MocA family protein n=1 Tax=uncultured Shewanella sp. TaxID=173975 RepID=UPI002620F8E8|nr:Gfo/Idh/MocA family oxidoreductase [uncultured Shewanella sp.]